MIEIKRKVSEVVVTEDGLFHKGQVPSDYTGPQITVEVVHAIVFADESGHHLTTFTCYAPKAMDNSRAEKAYDPGQMKTIEPPTAESFGSDSSYTHRYPSSLKTFVDGHIAFIESDGNSKVLP